MAITQRTILGVLLLSFVTFTSTLVNATPDPLAAILPDNSLIASPEGILIAQQLRQRIVDQGGCNLNVYFALHGSANTSNVDFDMQKEFVQLIAAIVGVDTNAAYGALQYGRVSSNGFPLTNDLDKFLLDVESLRLRPLPFRVRTFISIGLGFSIQMLRGNPEDTNKIVLFVDGRANFGGNPVPVARAFRPPRGTGAIFAVGVSFPDPALLKRITGSQSRVFAIDDFFELLDILDQLVTDICGLQD